MKLHRTRGVVLRSVRYGETSLIVSIYTELFGVQSYIVKGVRKTGKSGSKALFFQPAAILEMEVYQNELRNLQFIREVGWDYIYRSLFFEVPRNAVATYIVELLQHALKQPEASPELFYLVSDTLRQADNGSPRLLANLPVYFTLHLGSELGFRIQGAFNLKTPVLDLQEGAFVAEVPPHGHYLDGEAARAVSAIHHIPFYNELESIGISRAVRREIMEGMQQYMLLHVPGFAPLKSLSVLSDVMQ